VPRAPVPRRPRASAAASASAPHARLSKAASRLPNVPRPRRLVLRVVPYAPRRIDRSVRDLLCRARPSMSDRRTRALKPGVTPSPRRLEAEPARPGYKGRCRSSSCASTPPRRAPASACLRILLAAPRPPHNLAEAYRAACCGALPARPPEQKLLAATVRRRRRAPPPAAPPPPTTHGMEP
jgi:hypothetical protein